MASQEKTQTPVVLSHLYWYNVYGWCDKHFVSSLRNLGTKSGLKKFDMCPECPVTMDSNRPFLYTNRFKGFSYQLISHCNNLEFLEFSRLSHIPSFCVLIIGQVISMRFVFLFCLIPPQYHPCSADWSPLCGASFPLRSLAPHFRSALPLRTFAPLLWLSGKA